MISLMIPRLKPYFSHKEFTAALAFWRNDIQTFEQEFARTFNAKFALSFQYGRSALYAILKALNISNSEVILPSYTCIVVPNAIVASNNTPVFIDVNSYDFNMICDDIIAKITNNTRAIVITNLFGYPFSIKNIEALRASISKGILIIQDCALAFGTRDSNKLVSNEGDFAIYGMNLGKQLCSLQGGIATTNNHEYYSLIKSNRDEYFNIPGLFKELEWAAYMFASYCGLTSPVFGITKFLSDKTNILDRFVKYYDGEIINMPVDFKDCMTQIQVRIGLEQLKKIDEILIKRIIIVQTYQDHLHRIESIQLPPIKSGATYSHYVIRVNDRENLIKYLQTKGIECGVLFDYAVPDLPAYKKYKKCEFPHADTLSKTVVNLPNYPGLSAKKQMYIIRCLKEYYS